MNYPEDYYNPKYMTQDSLGYKIKDILHPYFGISEDSMLSLTLTPSQMEDLQKVEYLSN
jgi:hypothetical protein